MSQTFYGWYFIALLLSAATATALSAGHYMLGDGIGLIALVIFMILAEWLDQKQNAQILKARYAEFGRELQTLTAD